MGKTIQLFMWGFQEHFRIRLQSFTKATLAQIGVECEPEVLLVGIRQQDSNAYHPICIEPEYQKWNLDIFEGIIERIEDAYEKDPNHQIFYNNDDIAMREKPERIRRSCITTAISKVLDVYDEQNKTQSFCATAYPVDDYYVVPVIQIDSQFINQLSSVQLELYDYFSREIYNYQSSFLKSCITHILEQATLELSKPYPGKSVLDTFSKTDHIIPNSAKSFLSTLYHSIYVNSKKSGQFNYLDRGDLFNSLNKISSLSYEGAPIEGKLIIFNPENDAVHFHLRFQNQAPIKDYRWIRKLLNMTTADISLISDGIKVYGLGCLKDDNDKVKNNILIIDFLDHYDWNLYYKSQAMIRSTYENPTVPKPILNQQLFIENFSRIFPQSTQENQQHIWNLANHALHDLSGCMLIIVDNAEKESKRLAHQSTPIEPTMLTQDLLTRVRRIDGGILLDYTGCCYSIGVILDGDINSKCTPSRGSRYNSAIRYVYGPQKRIMGRMAIIISDDKSVDIEPLLNPKILEKELDEYILKLEEATSENYRDYQSWLDKRRFYINKSRCQIINLALERIRNLPHEDMSVRYIVPDFTPNEEMDDEYFYSD